MSRIAIRSLFPVSRASLRRRVWPAQLRLAGARQPAAGALGAAVIALTVVAAVTLGVPASPAWASKTCFTLTGSVVSDGSTCTGAVTIPKTVTSIGASAFDGTSGLTSVTFEEDSELQTIGNRAFANSGLTPIVIPKSVTSIGDFAFFGTFGLTSVTFEKDSALQTIGSDAFAYSGLTSIVIPKSVTSIGDFAFGSNLDLTSVTFEKDSALQTIGSAAFAYSGLTSIVIPKSVTSIGDYAFFGTFGLTSVTFEGNAPLSVGPSAFLNVADGATANIGLSADGFVLDGGGLWNGLVLVRAAAPTPSGPVGPVLACMPESPPTVDVTVTCTVTGGDAGVDILWRAAYNPVFAGAGVTLDASGAGTFSFVVPAAAFGQPITVELVDWTAPMSLGVAGGPVPTSVPSGGGPVPVRTLGLLAIAGAFVLRRGSGPGRSAWHVG